VLHGLIPPRRFFAYLTSPEIAALPHKDRVVLVQPLGAVEQHGPHLPLVVDAAISMGVLGKTLQRLETVAPQVPVYALPPLYYGKSNEHIGFAGTVTLKATTLMALLTDIAESLYRSGFRKLVFLNSHGGQPQILEIVARDLHAQYPDFSLFPLFTWRVPNACGELLTAKELEFGIHAGDGETSLMLALYPELVHLERAVCEYPAGLPQEKRPHSLLSMEGANPFAWVMADLTKSGVLGDATAASLEKGEQILTSLVESWAQLLLDIYEF